MSSTLGVRSVSGWLEAGLADASLAIGQTLPAERRLATELGVNRLTLRRALAALCREGVLRKLPDGKTQIAAPLSAPRRVPLFRQTIGVLAECPSKNEHETGAAFWESHLCTIGLGAAETLRRRGYDAWVADARSWTAEDIDLFMHMRPYGVILSLAPPSTVAESLVRRAARERVRLVGMGRDRLLDDCDRAYSDHRAGGAALARHLLSRGARRLWVVGSTPAGVDWRRTREEGINGVLAEAGLPPARSLETPDLRMLERPASAAQFEVKARLMAGYLAEALTGPEPVDAICAQNDVEGFLVARACRYFGRGPGRDLMVAGYDNMWEVATERAWEPWVPDATVDKENRACGAALAELLLERLHDPGAEGPKVRALEPRLVVPVAAARATPAR